MRAQAVLAASALPLAFCCRMSTAMYDKATQIQKLVWYYRIGDKTDAKIVRWSMRIYFPLELVDLERRVRPLKDK